MPRMKFLGPIVCLLSHTALAQPSEDVHAQQEASKAPRFGLGVRAGLIPPIFVTPEFTFRLGPFATGLYGLYLPSGKGTGTGGARATLGLHLTGEFGGTRSRAWYVSTGVLYYHEAPNASGSHQETDLAVPFTAGAVVRSGGFEAQFGGGIQFWSVDEPPCSGWCIQIKPPPVLPAVDIVVRYLF